ncbi:MAG: hypothetical protein ACRD51_13355 [Candidatus Acidiferrum sp.]
MQSAKRYAVVLIVLALILCAFQAIVWSRSVVHDHSETAKQNSESQHPPTEIPGIAGICLLLAAGGIAVNTTSSIGD